MGDLRHRVTRIRSCCQLSSDWAAMFVRWEWTTLPTCSQCSTATTCLSSRQMQSWQEMLCTQLNHAVVDQFDSFLSNDLTKLESLKLAYEQSRSGMYTYTLMTCAVPCMYTHVLWSQTMSKPWPSMLVCPRRKRQRGADLMPILICSLLENHFFK